MVAHPASKLGLTDDLLAIGIFAPADVRPVLKAYQGKNIPVEYAKKEAEQKQQAIDEWQRLHPTGVHGAGSGLLSSMFGSVSAVSPTPIIFRFFGADLTFSPDRADPNSQ